MSFVDVHIKVRENRTRNSQKLTIFGTQQSGRRQTKQKITTQKTKMMKRHEVNPGARED